MHALMLQLCYIAESCLIERSFYSPVTVTAVPKKGWVKSVQFHSYNIMSSFPFEDRYWNTFLMRANESYFLFKHVDWLISHSAILCLHFSIQSGASAFVDLFGLPAVSLARDVWKAGYKVYADCCVERLCARLWVWMNFFGDWFLHCFLSFLLSPLCAERQHFISKMTINRELSLDHHGLPSKSLHHSEILNPVTGYTPL